MESLNTPESGTIFFIDTTAANLDEEGGSTERRDLEESSMNVKIKMKDDKLTINKEYANKYHRRKEEEERSLREYNWIVFLGRSYNLLCVNSEGKIWGRRS